MPLFTSQDTWLIQDGSLNNGNFPLGCYMFTEYGKVGADPSADRQVNAIQVEATTYDLIQSVIHSDGSIELAFQGYAIARATMISDLKSFPIYSDVLQFDPADWDALVTELGGTP